MPAGAWPALGVFIGAWGLALCSILLVYRRQISAAWREPVCARPLLVIESDDWGAGPLPQAEALEALAEVLADVRDASGRPASLSLAVVLAVPDAAGGRLELDDPRLAPVLEAIRRGVDRGVFSLNLHGLEHYWLPALKASQDPAVAQWLARPAPAATEMLPPHLQSRWVDASVLPSHPLDPGDIARAVDEEVSLFRRVFGRPPAAVVPPTFVWTREVERAWGAAGVHCVVTPGCRYTRRGRDGEACEVEGPIRNGDRAGDLLYLARSEYFEPVKGRGAAHALQALARDLTLGRPCVLENHRNNFFQDAALRARSLEELSCFLRTAIDRHAGLRFVSTAELAALYRHPDADGFLSGRTKWPFLWRRLQATGRLWKLLRLIGAAAMGGLAVALLSTPGERAAAGGE